MSGRVEAARGEFIQPLDSIAPANTCKKRTAIGAIVTGLAMSALAGAALYLESYFTGTAIAKIITVVTPMGWLGIGVAGAGLALGGLLLCIWVRCRKTVEASDPSKVTGGSKNTGGAESKAAEGEDEGQKGKVRRTAGGTENEGGLSRKGLDSESEAQRMGAGEDDDVEEPEDDNEGDEGDGGVSVREADAKEEQEWPDFERQEEGVFGEAQKALLKQLVIAGKDKVSSQDEDVDEAKRTRAASPPKQQKEVVKPPVKELGEDEEEAKRIREATPPKQKKEVVKPPVSPEVGAEQHQPVQDKPESPQNKTVQFKLNQGGQVGEAEPSVTVRAKAESDHKEKDEEEQLRLMKATSEASAGSLFSENPFSEQARVGEFHPGTQQVDKRPKLSATANPFELPSEKDQLAQPGPALQAVNVQLVQAQQRNLKPRDPASGNASPSEVNDGSDVSPGRSARRGHVHVETPPPAPATKRRNGSGSGRARGP